MACCAHDTPDPSAIANVARYRRILWAALFINLSLFFIEVLAGYASGSLALLADAIDFAGDTLNYAVSLAVLSAALVWRTRVALGKALCMAGFGLYVLVAAGWSVWHGSAPHAPTMGAIGLLALLANGSVAWMLYAFREGDANMRSVWLCSRNDTIGNVAVMLAAVGVLGTGSAWPDLLVAAVMAGLALQGSWQVWRQARAELAAAPLLCDQKSRHSHDKGFTLIEMLVVIAIIAILAMMAMPSYQAKVVRDQVVEGAGLAAIAKTPVATAWQLTQTFPADNAAAALPAADKIVSTLVSRVEVENGAIHITFGNQANGLIKGKVLTLRPAVVEDTPIVPVSWVCGHHGAPDKMTAKGADKTTIAPAYLPLNCG